MPSLYRIISLCYRIAKIQQTTVVKSLRSLPYYGTLKAMHYHLSMPTKTEDGESVQPVLDLY